MDFYKVTENVIKYITEVATEDSLHAIARDCLYDPRAMDILIAVIDEINNRHSADNLKAGDVNEHE